MVKPHRGAVLGLALLSLLLAVGGCTREQVGASLRSWCQNTPDHCNVSAERR